MSCVCGIYMCYIRLPCCIYAVSSMEFQSSEIRTEADSNDKTDCSQDDEPSTGMSGFLIFAVALHLL